MTDAANEVIVKAPAASDPGAPDRLCVQEGKPFFDDAALKRIKCVWINDEQHFDDVVEYCISGRWARVQQKYPEGHPKAGQFMPNIYGKQIKVRRRDNVDIRVELK